MVINMETLSASPWVRERWLIRSYDGSVVAEVRPWDITGCRDEDHANANVISASPLLYQELKYALECINAGSTPGEKWKIRAEKAIACAEGLKTAAAIIKEKSESTDIRFFIDESGGRI